MSKKKYAKNYERGERGERGEIKYLKNLFKKTYIYKIKLFIIKILF